MSKSYEKFQKSIEDAKNLMALYDEHKNEQIKAEVLKRAGLIMALTAWETYVEDRLKESFYAQIKPLQGCSVGNFWQGKFEEELKRFHNPTSDKVKKVYKEFLNIEDVTESWKWNNYTPKDARPQLNHWLELRGDVVHNSRGVSSAQEAHAVNKEDLSKCIKFLEGLVEAFDKGLENN